jgi:hypothetical protein
VTRNGTEFTPRDCSITPFRPQTAAFRGPDARIWRVGFCDVVGSGFVRVLTRQAGWEADAGFAALFNHLIGTAKDRERYVQAERPSAPFLTFVSCCSEGFYECQNQKGRS